MNNHLIVALLIATTSTVALSAKPTVYISALGWDTRWHQMLDQASRQYAADVRNREMNGLSLEQQNAAESQIVTELTEELKRKIDVSVVADNIISNCEQDVLDQMIALESGVELPEEEKREIASNYSNCATPALLVSLKKTNPYILKFSERKRQILGNYHHNQL